MPPPSDPFGLDPGNPAQRRPVRPALGARIGRAIMPLLASSALTFSGCASSQPRPADDNLAGEGKALFGTATPSGKAPAGDAEGAWTIVIVAFRGPDQESAAAAGLAKARTAGGLRDAYSRQTGATTVIAYGHYSSPDAPDAQADLKRVREMTIDGGQPFAGAILAPPDGSGTGRFPDFDLRRARAQFGKDALYTLQIAAYGRDDRKPPQNDKERDEFARYAEDAAAQLRREGEQAFYYHGPNMSLVTIGIFGPEDFDPQHPEIRSDRLHAAQDAHPDNLLNGKGIQVRVPGVPATSPKAWRSAKSFLIVIPAEE